MKGASPNPITAWLVLFPLVALSACVSAATPWGDRGFRGELPPFLNTGRADTVRGELAGDTMTVEITPEKSSAVCRATLRKTETTAAVMIVTQRASTVYEDTFDPSQHPDCAQMLKSTEPCAVWTRIEEGPWWEIITHDRISIGAGRGSKCSYYASWRFKPFK